MPAAAQSWQGTALVDLVALAAASGGVAQVRVHGSAAGRTNLDQWSDLDVVLVIEPGREAEFFPGFTWLAPLGPVWASELHSAGERATVRLVFADARRIDVSLLACGVAESDRPGRAVWTRPTTPVAPAVGLGFPAVAPRPDPMLALAEAGSVVDPR
jgi:hypothetical protein